MERRDVMTGGAAASLGALLGSTNAGVAVAGAASQSSPQSTEAVARAIDALRASLERQQNSTELGPSPEITQIRRQQRTFLQANHKFPDFIDVGIEVWERIYDWHVKNQQPLRVARTQDGRYGLTFMFTTLVLRDEQTAGYVSFGYDRQ